MRFVPSALLVCAGFLSLSSTTTAAVIYGIDDSSGQTIISFDSANPSALLTGVAISGLQSNETVKGIDFRPATSQLFALGSSSRLYTLNPTTGLATEVPPPGAFTPTLGGSTFGFDFNPVIDRIRVVSNTKKNYVLNPNDGSATGVTDLFYGPADPNFGVFPNVSFSAYTNNVNPAPASTQLYGIDTNLDVLVTQANSAGTLGTVGPLNVNVGAVGGFDIYQAGTAFAALLPVSTSASNLYSINLATGAATNLGAIDGGVIVSSLAVAPAGYVPPGGNVPEPATVTLFALSLVGLLGRRVRG
jgi:hypothetical protein